VNLESKIFTLYPNSAKVAAAELPARPVPTTHINITLVSWIY
jgi:hypothetical protein